MPHFGFGPFGEESHTEKLEREMSSAARWGYFRIITGTIVGGILGFYVMHRVEVNYKEKWNERLKKYEEELSKKKEKANELEESL